MGYAARAVRHMTTYEYRMPCGLNHGLAILHEEMSHCLVPPMLEDAAELLGDFTAMTEALSACRVQIRAHENKSAHSQQEATNAAYDLRAEEEARLKRELNEARTQLRQVEAERDDAISQLLETQEERRGLQAQLSAKAAELRVNEGVVRQLEADLVEARRLQKTIPPVPAETPPEPRVTHSQALDTSISRITLGVAQPPASTTPVMQTALLLAETTSVRVTGARAIAHPVDSPYALHTVHGGCACHQPVGYISYGRACPENTGRVNRYHYQYCTYVPSPPPGYHVEDLPYPAAHESVRQPELHAIPVQQDPVRFQPIPANVGQSKLILAPPPPVPMEPAHAHPVPAQRELMDEAAAYPATTGPVWAVCPLPKPPGR